MMMMMPVRHGNRNCELTNPDRWLGHQIPDAHIQ